jgi:hypothetical protein
MGHHPSDNDKNERNERNDRYEKRDRHEKSDLKTGTLIEKPLHPFLEQNDVTMLSMIRPLLSPMAQRLVSFFVTMGEPESALSPAPDFAGLLKQFAPKAGSLPLNDLLPAMLGMAGNADSQGKINPALLTALMSMMNSKNE